MPALPHPELTANSEWFSQSLLSLFSVLTERRSGHQFPPGPCSPSLVPFSTTFPERTGQKLSSWVQQMFLKGWVHHWLFQGFRATPPTGKLRLRHRPNSLWPPGHPSPTGRGNGQGCCPPPQEGKIQMFQLTTLSVASITLMGPSESKQLNPLGCLEYSSPANDPSLSHSSPAGERVILKGLPDGYCRVITAGKICFATFMPRRNP